MGKKPMLEVDMRDLSRKVSKMVKDGQIREAKVRGIAGKEGNKMKKRLSQSVAKRIGITRPQAGRRIFVNKKRYRGRLFYVEIRNPGGSSIVHMGRLKISKRKRHKTGLTIKGKRYPHAFLYGGNRGEKSRVYIREGGGVKSFNHPTRISDVYKSVGPRLMRIHAKRIEQEIMKEVGK